MSSHVNFPTPQLGNTAVSTFVNHEDKVKHPRGDDLKQTLSEVQ